MIRIIINYYLLKKLQNGGVCKNLECLKDDQKYDIISKNLDHIKKGLRKIKNKNLIVNEDKVKNIIREGINYINNISLNSNDMFNINNVNNDTSEASSTYKKTFDQNNIFNLYSEDSGSDDSRDLKHSFEEININNNLSSKYREIKL